MKKSLVAGASIMALAGAVMPMAGVFADKTVITDTLQITVDAKCTFDTKSSSSDANTTYSATVLNGAIAELNNASSHQFDVTCNDNDGWTVTASAPLALSAANVATSHNINYQAAALPAANSQAEGVWNAIVTGDVAAEAGDTTGITGSTTKYIKTTGGVIATENKSTSGSTFTVTYGAYVGTETPTGTYTATTSLGADGAAGGNDGGTIDYTLAVI